MRIVQRRGALAVILLCLFSAAFLASRIAIIEGDLAPLEAVFYQKIDEFYYAGMAFEWLEGRFEPAALNGEISVLPNGIFYNVLVYLNLLLAGDTYYGLRLNVVLAGLFSSVTFSYLLYQRYGFVALLISLPLFLFTLPWFMASLAVDPQGYRLFHIAIFLAMAAWIERRGLTGKWPAMALLSLVAVAGPLFVYPSNLFLVFALYAVYLLRAVRNRTFGELAQFTAAHGVVAAATVLVWVIINTYLFGGVGPVTTFFSAFQERVALAPGVLNKGLGSAVIENFFKMQFFPLFADTPAVFWVYLAGLVLMAGRQLFRLVQRPASEEPWVIRLEDAICFISLAFFFQTLFLNDYPEKKLVVATPFIAYSALLVFRTLRERTSVPEWLPAAVFVLCMVAPSAVDARQLLFVEYSEKMKTAMLSLREFGTAQIAGGYSHGFRLYNDTRPYLNKYAYMYVSRDMGRYFDVLAGRVPGAVPEYALGIQLDEDDTAAVLQSLGFERYRDLMHGEKYVGAVAVFRRVSADGEVY